MRVSSILVGIAIGTLLTIAMFYTHDVSAAQARPFSVYRTDRACVYIVGGAGYADIEVLPINGAIDGC